jgi:hypothetical protein
MRVSSLSDERIIGLVQRYFVPVWISRDRYQLGPADRAEQEALAQVDRSRKSQGLIGGAVCVYLLRTDGSVGATMPVQQAIYPDKLLALLQAFVARERVQPRDPADIEAGKAALPAVPRPRTEGGRLLNVWTRFDDRGTNRGLSSDRVELTAAEWKAFVPEGNAEAGSSWQLPAAVVDKVLQYAYPPLPHWKASESKIVNRSLTATVVSVDARETVVRIEGQLEMLYPYTGKPRDGRVTARLAGVVRVDPARQTINTLALASEEAEYVRYWNDERKPSTMRIAVEMQPR